MTILEALDDPQLFARWFTPPETRNAWRAFLSATFGLPLPGSSLECYRCHTGRDEPPTAPAREAWVIVGRRRGGKSRIAALLTVFLACFRTYDGILAPGEPAGGVVI